LTEVVDWWLGEKADTAFVDLLLMNRPLLSAANLC
jgi:hypothetical protein